MDSKNYMRITVNGQEECFASAQFGRMSDVLRAIAEAINTRDEGWKDTFLAACGDLTQISQEEWESIAKEQKTAPTELRIVDVNLDSDEVFVSDWHNGKRNIVSGEIWKLAGCYEMSLDGEMLDADQLVTELMHHGCIQITDSGGHPAFTAMQM